MSITTVCNLAEEMANVRHHLADAHEDLRVSDAKLDDCPGDTAVARELVETAGRLAFWTAEYAKLMAVAAERRAAERAAEEAAEGSSPTPPVIPPELEAQIRRPGPRRQRVIEHYAFEAPRYAGRCATDLSNRGLGVKSVGALGLAVTVPTGWAGTDPIEVVRAHGGVAGQVVNCGLTPCPGVPDGSGHGTRRCVKSGKTIDAMYSQCLDHAGD